MAYQLGINYMKKDKPSFSEAATYQRIALIREKQHVPVASMRKLIDQLFPGEREKLVKEENEVGLIKLVNKFYTVHNFEVAKNNANVAMAEYTKYSKDKNPVKTKEELEKVLETYIHAKLLKQATASIREYREKLDKEYNDKTKELYTELHSREEILDVRADLLDRRLKGIRPIMTMNEWKVFVALCHEDKWPEVKSDDKRMTDMKRLFNALQKMKDLIDPLTPIAELRKNGWEAISPYNRKKDK